MDATTETRLSGSAQHYWQQALLRFLDAIATRRGTATIVHLRPISMVKDLNLIAMANMATAIKA
jgi:hypothetical protein